jgi:hypothetical protein
MGPAGLAIGGAIMLGSVLAANWDKWGVKDFFNDNVSNAFKDTTKWFGKQGKSIGKFFSNMFKKSSRFDESKVTSLNYASVNTTNTISNSFTAGSTVASGGFQSNYRGNGAATGLVVSGLNHLATRMNSIQEMQSGDKYSNNGEVFGSQEELDGYINNNIGNVGGIEKALSTNISLATGDNLPSGYSLVDNDIIGPNGRAGGITVPNGFKSSKIFIAPSLKGDYFGKVGAAKMGIVHEMLHGYHLYKGLANYNRYSEFATSTYTYAYLKAYGSPHGASYYLSNVQAVPRSFSWRNLPSIINTGLK